MLSKIYVFYVIFIHFAPVLCVSNNTKNVLVSFVTYDERPASVLMPHLCWSSYDKTSLARTLSKVGVNMAFSFQPNRSEYRLQHILIVADMSCTATPALLTTASGQGYFMSPYRWLLLDLELSPGSALLETLEMLIDSDVVVARGIGEEVLFTEAYKITAKSEIIYTTRSRWRPYTAIKTYLQSSNNSSTNSENGEIVKKTAVVSLEGTKTVKAADNEGQSSVKTLTISKYGIVEDYRKHNVLSVRRRDIKKHTLTMANVIADSNNTEYHLEDRLRLQAVQCAICSETRLKKHTLTMANVIGDSNNTEYHLEDRLNLHLDSITKMSYLVVKICFEMLNSTEKRIFTHTWGYKDKNGNWQGLIDILMKKEADLGTITIFTQERMMVMDYLAMIGTTSVRFVFREPPLTLISNIFTLPFSGAVWLAIFVCVLGCSVFLYITSKWEATMGMHPLQLDGSWADVLILIIGAVLQQGCTLEPRHAAGRCVTLLLFIALTILYAAYSANIVVLLRAPSSSVRSLSDLLNSPLELGASDYEYNRYFFKKLKDPLRKEIYNKKIAPKGKKPHYFTRKEGIEKVRKGLFAFHIELNPGYRIIQETYQEDEKCDLVEIDYINEISPWLPGQKRSPFKDLFKINFIKIRESGIQACIHHRLHVPRPKCSGTISTFSSVGITDMYPAMLATLYGMLLAPAVLLLEIAYKRL